MSVLKKYMMAAAGSSVSTPDYWIMTMGGDGSETGAGVDVDSENNIVLGSKISTGTGKYAGLHKLDQHGNVLWEYTVENQFTGTNSGPINESFNGIAIDKDTDDIYAVGGCHGLNSDDDQAGYLAKFNSEGALIFDRYLYCTEFATPSRAIVFMDVNLDPSKNIIIAGTRDGQYGTACQLSVKYDTQGLLVYAGGITAGSSDTRAGNSVANYSDSLNFFDYVYRTNVPSSATTNAHITRQSGSTGIPTHTDTTKMGSSTYGAYTGDIHYRNIPGVPVMLAAASTISTDGTGTSLGRLHGMVSAFNAGLTCWWNYEIDINTNFFDTWLYAIARDSLGNFIVAGNTNYKVGNIANSPSNLVILKFDYYGNLLWSRIIQNASGPLEGESIYFQNASNSVNSTNNSTVSKIAIDNNDDIIITAAVVDNAIGNFELFVAKLPSDGSGTGTYTTTDGTQAFEYIDYQFRDPTTITNTAQYPTNPDTALSWSTAGNDATSGNPAMLVSTHQSLRADKDEIPAPAIVTGNQEQTWSQANTGASVGNWRTIESLDNGITVVAGASGEIAYTNDLDQWYVTVTNATDTHEAMAVNTNNLVVAGSGGKVYTCSVTNVGAFASRTTGTTNTISHLASNRDNTYVLASTGYDQYTQVLKSIDSGVTWTSFNPDISYKVSSVGMDPNATADNQVGRRFVYTNHTTNNNRTILTQLGGTADTVSPWTYNEPIYPNNMVRDLNVRPATKLHSTGVNDGVLCGTQYGIMWYPWDSANGTPRLYGVGGQVRGLAYNPNTDTWLAMSPLTSTQLFKASGTDLTKWTPVETNITLPQTATANILTYNSTLDKFIIAGSNEVYYTA